MASRAAPGVTGLTEIVAHAGKKDVAARLGRRVGADRYDGRSDVANGRQLVERARWVRGLVDVHEKEWRRGALSEGGDRRMKAASQYQSAAVAVLRVLDC